MVLIEMNRTYVARQCVGISVPLRGLWFLSTTLPMKPTRLFQPFPSPCGDYGSYLNEVNHDKVSEIKKSFPSPCGDYGSYLATMVCIQPYAAMVSVPLRGLWFLSNTMIDSLVVILWSGFRPLAGIMVLIEKKETAWYLKTDVFPSPCGDYGSYQ